MTKIKQEYEQAKHEIVNLEKQVHLLQQHSSNLENILNTQIIPSMTFRLWQKYNKFKKLLIITIKDPIKILKAVKILFTQGPKALIKKLRSQEIQSQQVLSINQRYQNWLKDNHPNTYELNTQRLESAKFKYRPIISIITPVFDTPEKYLRECIESVINQTYDKWEHCIVDDASTRKRVKKIIKEYAKQDKRIKYIFRKSNGGICTASNDALKIATGKYVGLLDHDDILCPNALFEVVKFLNKIPEADFIYSDEDKISEDGITHADPFFKPDWSPDLLNSFMYTSHFTVYKRDLVKKVNGFTLGLEYSQDYDLALKISEQTKNIYHIQKILYSWRIHKESQAGGGKPFARKSNLQALANHMKRMNLNGKIKEYPYANKFDYSVDKTAKVSVIIPSDNINNIRRLINSIKSKTSYINYELIIVTNSKIIKKLINKYKNKKIFFSSYNKQFNFSEKCNLGAQNASGKYLIFINDDIEILNNQWIDGLIEFFNRKEVGAVSPKLVYKDDTIQYAGMVTGVRGLVGTAFHKKPANSYEYFNLLQSTRNVSILCGACFAIPKQVFLNVGGFNQTDTPIYHSDIDLSFKLRKSGLLIIYTPFVKLKHYGHKSLKTFDKNQQLKKRFPDLFLLKNWPNEISYDPYFPPMMRDFLYEKTLLEFKIFLPKRKIRGSKNILFVSHEASLTGAPLLIYQIARELLKRNYYPLFLVASNGPLIELLNNVGISVILDEEIKYYIKNETVNFMSNFDISVCNTIDSWPSVLALNESLTKSIFYIHESNYGIEKLKRNNLIKLAFKSASKIIFPNKNVVKKYTRLVSRIRHAVLTPGIRLFEKEQDTKNHNLKKFIMLNIGSIEDRKGQAILLDAFLKLPNEIKKESLILFIGKVLNQNYYYELLQKKDGNKNIIFTGEINHDEIIKYYAKADLYVCSSKDETGPLTLLEAIRAKIPVISTKVGLAKEIIDHGKNGILVNPNSSSELSKAIETAYNKKDEVNNMTNLAYEKLVKDYNFEDYIDKFVNIISNV